MGGIAVNLHGIIRPTKDIDFVVHLERENLNRFLTLITNLGYKPNALQDRSDIMALKKLMKIQKEIKS